MKLFLQIALPFVVVALGAAAMMGLISLRPEPAARSPEVVLPLVEVQRAIPEAVQLSVYTQGTVVPRTQSRLVAEVSGRLTWVSPVMVSGGFFEEGEHLLSIDSTDYELAVEQAKMSVSQAELRLAQEEADAALARSEWESLGRGEDPNPLTVREPQVAEARAALDAAKALLRRATRDVERCRVNAPYAGRVRAEHVDPGQYVTLGAELAQVYAIDRAEVRLPLADSELAYLDIPLTYRGDAEDINGPTVTLRANFAGEEHRWDGHIVRTEGELDPMNRMVVAVASVDNPYGRDADAARPPLAVGMFVEAEIEGRVIEGAIVLPRRALRGRAQVYVVEDGRLGIRPVRVFKAESERIVLDSAELGGTDVVVSPLEAVTEGMRVKVVDAGGER